MYLLQAIIYLLYLIQIAFTGSCPGVGSYNQQLSTGKSRLTTIHDGNYTIQALITLTAENSECSRVSRDGLVKTFAMKYAVNKFNINPKYSDVATLGLQLDDVCRSLPITMARGIEVVSFHRQNSVCRADFLKCDSGKVLDEVKVKEASAIIGTAMSFTTIPLASLMSLYYIPQVSYSASSRLLSKKDLYKSFFRTIPSDTNQISVMLDIFKKFDWNYIIAIGSDDDYGKLGVSGLKQAANARDICVARDEYVPFQSSKTVEKIKDVVTKIKENPKARVVVLFCYVVGLGDLILQEAERQGIKRLWLTSESWNPNAATYFSQPINHHLRNQTHGILSVSLKRYPMTFLTDWIEDDIRKNYQCNMWLKQYLHNKHNCKIGNLNADTFNCTNNKTLFLDLENIMTDLKNLPGNVDRMIDAVTALGHSIHKVLEKRCPKNGHCSLPKIQTSEITKEMFKVNFTNEQDVRISFNVDGDPEFAYYTIENLIYNEEKEKLEYVQVGSWSRGRTNSKLVINQSDIEWPSWFNGSVKQTDKAGYIDADFPASRCSDRCVSGEYVIGKNRCCWGCQKCQGNNYTDKEMLDQCKSCGNYSHTLNNKNCTLTPIFWLEIDDPAGLSIVIISLIGLIGWIATTIFVYKYWHLVTVHEKSPQLLIFVCVLLFFTFIYGPMHITEPTELLCMLRNSYFFVLLMMYCAFVLVKTQAMVDYLHSNTEKMFGGKMVVAQFVVLFLMFLLEVASVVAFLYVDGRQIREFREPGVHLIRTQCEVEFTAARLVSTFIPCIILIIATFCSFRERNADHSFYEPKFLSFSCIALCIIIVAFLPTFKYVVGIYKAVVLAFTMNVFGYTFVACLILPKVYVGVIRNKRGINEYPMKPGATKKDKKEKKEKKKQKKKEKNHDIEPSNISSMKTKSTVVDEATDDDIDGIYDDVGKETDIESVRVEDKQNGKSVNGYNNETYEDADIENDSIVDPDIDARSPPPDYEACIQENKEYDNTKC